MNQEEAAEFAKNNSNALYSFDGKDFFDFKTLSVQQLLKDNPQIFKEISGPKDPYYYRPLDKEFSGKKT